MVWSLFFLRPFLVIYLELHFGQRIFSFIVIIVIRFGISYLKNWILGKRFGWEKQQLLAGESLEYG